MIGVAAHPDRTLSERVLERLALGPRTSAELCDVVLGLVGAPMAVAHRIAVALLGPDPRVRQLPDGRWSLVAEAQGSPLLDDCAFAVVDVETTGSRAGGGDRVTEVAVVVVQGARCEVVLNALVNPGRPIPDYVKTLTGITDEDFLPKPHKPGEPAQRLAPSIAEAPPKQQDVRLRSLTLSGLYGPILQERRRPPIAD